MRGVDRPCEIICHVDSKEPDVVRTLHFPFIYIQRKMSVLPGPPEVNNDLFHFCGVHKQVVHAPLNQMLNLLSVIIEFEEWIVVQS